MEDGHSQDENDYWLPQMRLDGGLYFLNTVTSETTREATRIGFELKRKSCEEVNRAIRKTSPTMKDSGYEEDDPVHYWIPQETPHGILFYLNCLTGETTCKPPVACFAYLKEVESEPEPEPESESGTDLDVEEVEEMLKGAMPAPDVFLPEWRLQASFDRQLFYYDTRTGNITFGLSFPKPWSRTVPRDPGFELALSIDLDDDRDDTTARLYILDKVSKSWDRRMMPDGSVYCYNTETEVTSRLCPPQTPSTQPPPKALN